MKKLLSIICVFAMLFSCMGSFTLAANAEGTSTVTEYITNGSFDNDGDGWTVPYGDWSIITDSSTGNKMVKITPYACNLRQLDIELPAGKYVLSFEAKSDNADYTSEILVDYANDTNVTVLSTTFDIKSAGFNTYTFEFVVETAGKYNVKIGKNGKDPENKYIDNVSLVNYIEPEVETTDEFITNGSFDDGANGWTVPYGDWSVITDSSTGNKMVKIVPYACNLRQLDIELPAGTYVLSFSAKSDNADYTSEVLVDYANDTNIAVLSTTFDIKSSGFNTYTFVFVVETAGKYNVKIGKNGKDPENKYIDNVSLVNYIEPEVETTDEFITNGSFDNGNNAWMVPYNEGMWGVITDSTSGNSMMKIQAYQSNLRQLDIELPVGKYVLSFKAKSDEADFSSPVLVDGTATVLSTNFDFKCSGFMTYAFTFEVVAAGKYNVKLGGNGSDKYNKYFDDVSLKLLPDERIKNGGFDDEFDNWVNNYGDYKADGTTRQWMVNTDPANDNKVMKLMAYHGMMYQQIFLIADESYTLTFEASYDSEPFDTYAIVKGVKNTATEGAEILNATVSLTTTNFDTYKYSFTPTVTGYYTFNFGHPQGGDPYVKYIDNISITVTPYNIEWVGTEEADIFETDEYIMNIPEGWTVKNIISLYNCDNVSVTADTIGTVKTGTVFTAVTGEETVWTKQAVVIGDLNGSGKVDVVDLVVMKKYLAEARVLEGAYFEAGRICGDDNIITEDLVILRQILLGAIELNPNDKELKYLENTYYKLSRGETVNLAFVGGSVTQGTGGTSGGWPKIIVNELEENYGADCVEYRQSIGGTGSLLDAFRFDYDNEGITPDVLFIEFAINDYYKGRTTEEVIRDSESIVRKAYAKNPYMDIVYVLTFDSAVKDTEYTQFAAHKAVADKYGLMTIALGPKFYEHIAQTGEAFSVYFTDAVHPNDKGYELYSKFIIEALYSDMPKTTNVSAKYQAKVLPELMSDVMMDARIVTADQIDISTADGWTYSNADFGYTKTKYGGYVSSVTAGSVLTFTFEGTDGGIWYDRSTNMGMVTISIDGGDPIVIDGYSSYHLSDYYVFSGLEDTTHTITVTKIDDTNEASTGKEFRIGSLLFN